MTMWIFTLLVVVAMAMDQVRDPSCALQQDTEAGYTQLLQADVRATSNGPHKVKGRRKVTDLKRKSCSLTYQPGTHLIQMEDIGRQLLLVVPNETVAGPKPLVIAYHGFSDSPWYTNKHLGFSTLLNRYGWLGIMPFGLNGLGTNGLAGTQACCPDDCDEECCMNGHRLNKKDKTACRWEHHAGDDVKFTEALVTWATSNACVDSSKVFATGFSNGAGFANLLGCEASHLFRVVAPISGTRHSGPCNPSHPTSYLNLCGSKDDEAYCQMSFRGTAQLWAKRNNCQGNPVQRRISATTNCTEWSTCEGGNFVETCEVFGLAHDISGHLRPDDTSYIRPGSDIDFPQYIFQKFSIFAGESVLFFGHPTSEELAFKKSSWPPPQHNDHLDIRHP